MISESKTILNHSMNKKLYVFWLAEFTIVVLLLEKICMTLSLYIRPVLALSTQYTCRTLAIWHFRFTSDRCWLFTTLTRWKWRTRRRSRSYRKWSLVRDHQMALSLCRWRGRKWSKIWWRPSSNSSQMLEKSYLSGKHLKLIPCQWISNVHIIYSHIIYSHIIYSHII